MDKGHLESEHFISEEKSKQKKDMQSQKRLLTLNEAAEYLGISYWTMREYAVNRCVACVKLPCPSGNGKKFRRTLIDPKDLDAFIERNRIVRCGTVCHDSTEKGG